MSISIEEFSDVVARIYEAALDPSLWTNALVATTKIVHGQSGFIVEATDEGRAMIAATGLDPTAVDAYDRYYGRLDPIVPPFRREAGRDLLTTRKFDGQPPQGTRREFCNDWALPNDSRNGMFVNVLRLQARTLTLGFAAPDRRRAFVEADNYRLVALLASHLKLAARTSFELEYTRLHRDRHAAALQKFRHGLVIVEADKVLFANDAALAIARTGDGIILRGDRPHATDRTADMALQAAIVGAGSFRPRRGARVAIPRPSGDRSYALTILPLGEVDSDLPVSRWPALIIIADPSRAIGLDSEGLSALFGLTKAEARVALRLLHGVTLQGVADQLGVTISTVRIHLSRVYEKTGTNKQSQLIRLLIDIGV